jgi:hypothetical protein
VDARTHRGQQAMLDTALLIASALMVVFSELP